jgi:hypothetical protein
MRSATEMPDQSSSGGVSPARNTLLVMTRRRPASDGITQVYHSARPRAMVRSSAAAEPSKGGATATMVDSSEAQPKSRSVDPARAPYVRFAGSGLSSVRTDRFDSNDGPSRKAEAFSAAPIPSRRTSYGSASGPAWPRQSVSPHPMRYMPVRLRRKDAQVRVARTKVALGCLQNDWR